MVRIALGVEYDGSGFAGWQWQPNRRSVQAELEKALSKVANHPVTVICAGRTDAGVHALEQVVHFDVNVERDLHAWLLGGNSNLPDEIRITWVKQVVDDFHARYSAIARLYRYMILNRPVKSAILGKQTTWCYHPLDADVMNKAAQHLVGNHDFTSFRAQGCQSKSPFRIVHFVEVYREGEKVIIQICANAFLHHMVRNIAGVLMDIGIGKQAEDWTLALLVAKKRELGGATAPPSGLYLESVYYPPCYGFTKHPAFNRLPGDTKRFDSPLVNVG
ncbi:tRNA pseudouridine synthase A [Methyloglobulus morosus KoM1]|uniref:tRNA pseudouridine synthase A n=1 Tax=Methyloglobulus morosus KoM1 TaxID=1116472 RepID=V5BZK1_9GAMM|nr:tRNA pseudouridine(38-40) synthase TruA [Methyloglobulus morosus]ESS69973.1 tRNA pseudouridine synthase A [Methyloglobulus morosus KoM1]